MLYSGPSTYSFSLHLLPTSVSVQILFFIENMTDVFCDLLSIKEPQIMLQNKEITLQSYRKMLNQNNQEKLWDQGCAF